MANSLQTQLGELLKNKFGQLLKNEHGKMFSKRFKNKYGKRLGEHLKAAKNIGPLANTFLTTLANKTY
ncbi:hypothetical protein [Shewanella marisflavi]|uniref:hypothetical protein n=1 Tax=Shewanella marisflavi TaxID=260364 RepID=UPI003AAA4239